MRIAICVNKGNMAKRAMNSLDIIEVTRVSFKAVKEALDMIKELKSLDRGETDLSGRDVP